MTIVDRAIAAFSPAWGLRRSVARTQLHMVDSVTRRQSARQKRRGDENWTRNDPRDRDRNRMPPNARRALSAIERSKIRTLFRVNPFAKKMKANLLNNLVGYGITATPKGSKRLQNDWQAWIASADYDGVQDLYGLQEMAVWSMLRDGEAFAVRRIIAGAAVNPLRIQLLSVDQLDYTVLGANIRDGVEYGTDGRPVAYHFKGALDVMFGAGSSKAERIDAVDVIHLFRREEPGQWRGWSHFEAVLEPLEDADDYIESEGVRKKLESCFVAFVSRDLNADQDQRGLGDPGSGGEAIDVGAVDGPPRAEGFYPGMINYLDQGETVSFGEPKAAGGFDDYLKWAARRGAAGAEVTYEGLTGDLSNVNFSSYRAGANEFETGCGRLQWLTIIPQFCERIVAWWKEAGYATGRISDRDRKAEFKHTPPRVKTIDRAGDAKAALLEMLAGLESRRNLIAERGNDHDNLMDEIAEDKKANTERGIAFQGDPLLPAEADPANPAGTAAEADRKARGVAFLLSLLGRETNA